MEGLTTTAKLYEAYIKALRRCYDYKQKKLTKYLLNEIGVLRGLATALALNNVNICNREYDSYIKLQNTLLER